MHVLEHRTGESAARFFGTPDDIVGAIDHYRAEGFILENLEDRIVYMPQVAIRFAARDEPVTRSYCENGVSVQFTEEGYARFLGMNLREKKRGDLYKIVLDNTTTAFIPEYMVNILERYAAREARQPPSRQSTPESTAKIFRVPQLEKKSFLERARCGLSFLWEKYRKKD